MDRKQGWRTQYSKMQRASDSDLPALTMCRARRYLNKFPQKGPAWLLLGIALIEMARYDEAEQAILKAIERCPPENLWIPYVRMGDLFKFAGDYEQAAEWYRKTIERFPQDASGYTYLGGVLARQGRLREAEEVHREGTRCIEGCLDEAFLNLGLVLRAQERFEEAAECFREAIQQDPEYRAAKKALRDVVACLKEARDT